MKPTIGTKYNFEGIGGANAKLVISFLAANASTAWLTVGFVGACVKWALTRFFSYCASVGVVLLNVGISQVKILAQQKTFDATLEGALAALAARDVTPAEGKAIDDKVIDAHNDFGGLGSTPE